MTNSKEQQLAVEIATALDDMNALTLHISYTERYSEKFLREKLKEVLNTPREKIRRSRAAFYNYLIQQHERNKRYMHGD